MNEPKTNAAEKIGIDAPEPLKLPALPDYVENAITDLEKVTRQYAAANDTNWYDIERERDNVRIKIREAIWRLVAEQKADQLKALNEAASNDIVHAAIMSWVET